MPLMSKANRPVNRAAIVRSRTERPKGWVPPNAMVEVDPHRLGEGIALRWIRKYFTRGEEDVQSFFKRLQRGWTPVALEEIPELSMLRDPDGNIASNGCVLCKNDAARMQIDVEYYEDMAIGNLASESAKFLEENASGAIPKFQKGSKKSFVGKLPS